MVGAKIEKNNLKLRPKALAKKEFSELLNDSNVLTTAISKIPKTLDLENLSLAVTKEKE